ncbi:MAG: hypothetical protein ACI91G_000652 [Gammaproteobacteria bacterium]|jgi:hypothetical protein
MNNSKLTALNFYSLVSAVLLAIGETVVVLIDPNKPFALSLDDYLVVIGLIAFASKPLTQLRRAGLAACWAFACGNLWVILIVRLEGDGERLGAVIGALLAAIIGLICTGIALHKAKLDEPA